MRFNRIAASSMVAALLAAGPAGAATDTMEVTATVLESCSVTAGNLSFGDYDPVNANRTADLEGQADITFACTKGTTAKIGLDAGTASSGGTAEAPARNMTPTTGTSSDRLSYTLFRDAGFSTPWGEGTAGEMSVPATGVDQTVTVYGIVDAGQNVEGGTYRDTVTVTVAL